MKRPKFFEDLDISLAGEEVVEEPTTPLLSLMAQSQPTKAEIAQQTAMMRQFEGMNLQAMETHAMIEINARSFAVNARSLASSSTDVFPLRWR